MTIKEEIAALVVAVTENRDANASAILAFEKLGELVIDNAEGSVQLNEIGQQITSQARALAAAIPANTPAALKK